MLNEISGLSIATQRIFFGLQSWDQDGNDRPDLHHLHTDHVTTWTDHNVMWVTTPIKDTSLSTRYKYGAYGRISYFLSSRYCTITSLGIAWKRPLCFSFKGFSGTFPNLVRVNGLIGFLIAFLSLREFLMNCLVISIKRDDRPDSELSSSKPLMSWIILCIWNTLFWWRFCKLTPHLDSSWYLEVLQISFWWAD